MSCEHSIAAEQGDIQGAAHAAQSLIRLNLALQLDVDAIDGAGIFKTTDRGESWTQLTSTITNDFISVNRLIIDPANEDVVVAATNTGIFRTQDGGTTWNEVYRDTESGERRIQDLKFQPGDFSVQIATQNSCCILRSTDGGTTWTKAYESFFNGVERIEIATSIANPDWIYAAVQVASDRGGDIYLSMDAGVTWTLLEDPSAGDLNNWLGGQGWYDNAIAVHPFSPDTVFIGGIKLWRTSLFGENTVSGGAPVAFNRVNTDALMNFVDFTGSHFGGVVNIGPAEDQAVDVTLDDMTSVEIRFGPGQSQMAHRFSVSPTGGPGGEGGSGIQFAEYIYEDYVEVPFEVWDTDNNEQLAVSFRDQADDGVYNLINLNTSGPRDTQSREYIIVHRLPYDANAPNDRLAVNGAAGIKLIYFMWPYLVDGAVWNAASLPNAQLQLEFANYEARQRLQARVFQPIAAGDGEPVDHHSITFIPLDASTNNYSILNGNDQGVFFLEDRSSTLWKDTRNGYVTIQFYDADKRAGSSDYIAGAQDNGTWRSLNNPDLDSDWRFINGGDGFDVFQHSEDPDRAIYSSQFNGFVRTTNGGFLDSGATSGLGDVGSGSAPFITSLGWSKERPDVVFAVGATGVWRSTNFAQNWSLAQSISSDEWGFGNSGFGCRVRVSLADPDIVWAGCIIDSPSGNRTMHLSRDGGSTFDPIPVPQIANGPRRLSGFATHPSEPGTAYMIFSSRSQPKILRTTNFGFTWEDLSGFVGSIDNSSTNGFPDVAVNDLLVLPSTPTELWAATEIGIFISTDSGATWSYSDNGLPAVSVWRLRHHEGEIIAATHGRGLWTVEEPIEVSNEETDAVPTNFTLRQNYPNPFNPETNIEFTLPAATDVEIKVFDVNGREVATLADTFLPAGQHAVSWNAAEFASGVYLYRMTAGDFTATKQLTLLK